MNVNYNKDLSEETKKAIVVDYVENLFSIREIMKKYGIKSCSYLNDNLLKNVKRTSSEAAKIARKKYPESYKLNEETKNKIREARLKFMKEHPEQTAWRQKNISFPEKCFKQILEENEYDKRFLIYREYSIYPYYIDYAFVDIKVAVEIDGSQHLEKNRKESDERKDKLLIDEGWKVIRFTASDVMYNKDYVINMLYNFITSEQKYERVGILKYPKFEYKKKERNSEGYTEAQLKMFLKNRKVKNRPSKEELFDMLKTSSFKEVGRKYGVSDNTVKKWCKGYCLPSKRKEYDEIINKTRKFGLVKHICKKCQKEYFGMPNSICCSKKCFDEYIKDHYHEHYHGTRFYHIYKIYNDNTIRAKRVEKEEIEEYLNDGWNRGRKPKQ